MHNHSTCCEHEVKYCKVCDVCYCMKCGKEWKVYQYNWSWTGTPTWIPCSTNTAEVAASSGTVVSSHSH